MGENLVITDAQLENLRRLAIQVAPEMNAAPLYVITQPDGLPAPSGTAAYIIRYESAAMQSHLVRIGKWVGPGWVIVFVRQNMTDMQNEIALLHELAHLLPYRTPSEVVDLSEANVDASLKEFEGWAETDEHIEHMPRWVGGDHGREFTRICLHLWWRAALAGSVLRFDGLCGGWIYNLSPPFLYWTALGAEPIRMQNATFAEILATDPPKEFVELWEADLAYWMNNNAESVQTVMRENRNVA